ncbi:hypothetical protein [Cod iridovirus]|uniref:Uncharacterized protein n=1 Tax=Cod iridovirus TaxID=1887316 RepID=A0A1B2IU17_FRG3V|nr:hypothetical protein [Cod iridovirus]
MASHYYSKRTERPSDGELASIVAEAAARVLSKYSLKVRDPPAFSAAASASLSRADSDPSTIPMGMNRRQTAVYFTMKGMLADASARAVMVQPRSVHPAHPSTHFNGTSSAVRPSRHYNTPGRFR